jgi:hypothetical protein
MRIGARRGGSARTTTKARPAGGFLQHAGGDQLTEQAERGLLNRRRQR